MVGGWVEGPRLLSYKVFRVGPSHQLQSEGGGGQKRTVLYRDGAKEDPGPLFVIVRWVWVF